MRSILRAMSATVLLGCSSALAGPLPADAAPGATADDVNAYLYAVADELATRSDARSLLLAARLLPKSQTLERDALVQRAIAADPDDVLVAWMRVADCPGSSAACDADAALRMLRQLDPDNALPWLIRESTEPEIASDSSLHERLRRAADAPRWSSYAVERAQWVRDGLDSTGAVPPILRRADGSTAGVEEDRAVTALGLYLADATPFGDLESLCSPQPAPNSVDDTLALCESVASAMLSSADTIADRRFALHLLTQITTEAERQEAIRRAGRELEWQSLALAEIADARRWESGASRAWLNGICREGGELSALHRILGEARVSPEPPEDWKFDPFL